MGRPLAAKKHVTEGFSIARPPMAGGNRFPPPPPYIVHISYDFNASMPQRSDQAIFGWLTLQCNSHNAILHISMPQASMPFVVKKGAKSQMDTTSVGCVLACWNREMPRCALGHCIDPPLPWMVFAGWTSMSGLSHSMLGWKMKRRSCSEAGWSCQIFFYIYICLHISFDSFVPPNAYCNLLNHVQHFCELPHWFKQVKMDEPGTVGSLSLFFFHPPKNWIA